MLLDKLFLRVAFSLFLAIFCAAEIKAVPPEQNQTGLRTSPKRLLNDSEDDQDLLAAVIAAEEEYLKAHPKPETHHPSKKQKLEEDDQELLAAVIAAEEEYLKAYPKPETHHPSKIQNISDEDPEFWSAVFKAADEAYLSSHSSQGATPSAIVPESSKVTKSDEDPDFWAAVAMAADEAYLSNHSSQEAARPIIVPKSSKATKSDEDPDFWAAVAMAADEAYLSSHSSQEAALSTVAHESREDEDLFDGFTYNRLNTAEDHQRHLINAIHSAQHSILITSYNFSADMREGNDLFEAVRAASYRGVKLYFYANTIQLGESEISSLSKLQNLLFDKATVHSKLLVVDNKQVTCGSYDWLAKPWIDVSQNASLILEGGELKPMVDRIWDVLRKYQTVDFNPYAFGKIEKTLRMLPPLFYQFENSENSFKVLNTPYEHGDVFKECFEEAQHQLTFCAPFITGNNRYLKEILPQRRLIPFLKSGKKLNIIYRADDEKIDFLKAYLDKSLSQKNFRLRKNVTLTPVDGLHRKSLFVDEDQYIEGSYNWLSSARSLDDPYYYMETSLRFTGAWAKQLIREFYNSVL